MKTMLCLLQAAVAARLRARSLPAVHGRRSRVGMCQTPDRGQTTAEYALVLVGAATIATLVIAWAATTNRISGLMDTVLRSVTGLAA